MKIVEILEKELPEIIKEIARENNITPYIDNPDFLEERLHAWHQFGLLTHTKKVREIFLNEKLNFKEVLSQKIDGIEKQDLIEISIILHDLGKIIGYDDKRVDRGHEFLSKQLVNQSFLNKKLKDLGLTDEHIFYIERCIETHDVLGKELRDKLKHDDKLKLDYISEENIGELCKQIAGKYSDVKLEIGIFFLCDLLGKTDIRVDANVKEKEIEDILKKKNLPEQLKKAVMQLPITIKLAEIYLKVILRTLII